MIFIPIYKGILNSVEVTVMWVICAGLSVIFCVIAWVLKIKKSEKASWASACSLSFVAITLLLQYKMIFEWVNKEDWSALLDVVPSVFYMLAGYVIVMLLANLFPVITVKRG